MMTEKPTYEELVQRVKDLEKKVGNVKRVEKAMHDSEERLSLAFETSNAGM